MRPNNLGPRSVSEPLSTTPAEPVSLSLVDNLPPCREFDLTNVSMPIQRSLDEVMKLFHSSWILDGALPEGIVLHPATSAAFSQHLSSVPQGPTPPLIEIFTDGSFDGQRSFWAFAAVASWPQGSILLGHARGVVALTGDNAAHSALAGEQTALFWAVAWTLQLPCRTICFFWSDCLVAKG